MRGQVTVGAGAAGAGLVSVETTHTRGSVERLARSVEAFLLPDRDLSRLAKMRRSIGFAARAIATQRGGFRPSRAWMVTLTYVGVRDWQPDHISTAMTAYREWCRRAGHPCEYVWVAELQKRGAIHYHIVLWLPEGVRMPKWDADRGWWPHGMAQRVIVKRSAIGYLMKYLQKGADYSGFPKGVRTYGIGGLERAMRKARAWLRAPGFVKGNASCEDDFRPVRGGGWAINGVWMPSEFRCVLVAGARAAQRVLTHARAIQADGPFCWAPRGAV